jgi:hypothetical protein
MARALYGDDDCVVLSRVPLRELHVDRGPALPVC